MLLFKQSRFHIAGVSFAIPENFYLKTDTNLTYEYGIELASPHNDYTIVFRAEANGLDAKSELELRTNGEYKIIKEAAPFHLNGLEGWHIYYSCASEQYYEAVFDLAENNNGLNQFCIEILTSPTPGIRRLMEYSEVQDCIKAVEKENKFEKRMLL